MQEISDWDVKLLIIFACVTHSVVVRYMERIKEFGAAIITMKQMNHPRL